MNEIELELFANKLYFSKEAAEYLGITVQRLNKLIQEGKIKPLKKNASGTIFYIDELERRKEELSIFTQVEQEVKITHFEIDTKTKQEALNFATLMNVLNYTESKLEPYFDKLGNKMRLDEPLIEKSSCQICAEFFHVEERVIIEEYQKAENAFFTLRPTDEIIKRGSLDYPSLLAETKQAPRFLYLRGKKALLQEKRTVALVGSRKAGQNAIQNTMRLTKNLGNNGILIISGLAKGIDVAAHQSALDSGYNTIAVIGTSLNQYYPSENEMVQRRIEEMGLVVSQFSPALKTQRWFFPLRNGVMSGLSLATVIMEAGETSGALKQADFALKQGRKVMIPRSALQIPSITWPAKYVQRGAVVVESPSDVIRILSQNHIFQIKKEANYKQQNLADYLEEMLDEKINEEENDFMVVEG